MTQVKNNSHGSLILPLTLVAAAVLQLSISTLILVELRSLDGQVRVPMGAPPSEPGVAIGETAPPFDLPDSRNEEVSLADFRGRKVMLVFSSSDCRFCKEMYPELKQLTAETSTTTSVVMLQLRSTPEENQSLSIEQGFNFPVLVASKQVFLDYGVRGTPFSILVNEAGEIVAGATTASYDRFRSLLAGS